MYDMLINKEQISSAVLALIKECYNPMYSPDERRGMRKAFEALAESVPIGSQLSLIFSACAQSIPISRKNSKYLNPYWALKTRLAEVTGDEN